MARTKTETGEPTVFMETSVALEDVTPSVAESEGVNSVDDMKTTIYMGPNIPGGLLFEGATFKGNLPNFITVLFEKFPNLEHLFIDVTFLPRFKQQVVKKGTIEHQRYQTALVRKEDSNGL